MNTRLEGCESLSLPILTHTRQQLRRILAHRHGTNQELQQVLWRDPGATIMLYQAIEKLRPGTAHGVSSPAHALSLMGHQAFLELVDKAPTLKALKPSNQAWQGQAYSQAAHAAHFASDLCQSAAIPGTDEVVTAALLQNPAILALWALNPAAAQRATAAIRLQVPFDQAFSTELGEPLNQANRRLAVAWHFPQLARQVAGNWDPYNKQAQSVRICDLLAQTHQAHWPLEATDLQIEILQDFLNCPPHSARTWWQSSACQAARELLAWGYPLPAFQLAAATSGGHAATAIEPINPPQPTQQANPTTAAMTDPSTPPNNSSSSTKPPQTVPQPLPSSGKKPIQSTLQERLIRALGQLRHDTGAQHVVMAMLDKGNNELRSRITLGCDDQASICQLKVKLDRPHLFSLLLSKQQSVWINARNRKKYIDYLTLLPLEPLREKDFFAMSLWIRNKPLGLIYADNQDSSETNYQHFRTHCARIIALLGGKVL